MVFNPFSIKNEAVLKQCKHFKIKELRDVEKLA